MTEKECWLWLSHVDDMWHGKMKYLYECFGSAKEIYEASEKKLSSLDKLKEKDVHQVLNGKREINLSEIIRDMNKKRIGFTYYEEEIFPEKLKNIPAPPMVLFYKGELPKNNNKSVGMVGARACSEYGRMVCKKMASEITSYGIDIISGMARGIDSSAHRGCIDSEGKTYAILGCGVDVCYPAENIELYDMICNQGGIISEYVPKTRASAYRFPERNRIISGLSDIVIMIEAKEKSGSFITVDHALEQGKTIFALPGRVTDSLSEGCNRLILEGATPLINSKQIAIELGVETDIENKKNNFFLEKENEVLYSCLGLLPISVEELVKKTGIDSNEIYQKLMNLQLKGIALEVTKGQFIRKL